MKDLVPTDAQFQAEFSTCRVTKASLARYYLRALELCYRGEKEPEFVPNEDQSEVNLEHVLPENPGKKWTIKAEIAAALLQAARKPRAPQGNSKFNHWKRTVFGQEARTCELDLQAYRGGRERR